MMNCKKISFGLNFSESNTIKSHIGKTINAGSHLDKIAAPMLTPARILKIVFRFCANKILNTTANSMKNKKKISMWSVATLPAVNSIINPLMEKKKLSGSQFFY